MQQKYIVIGVAVVLALAAIGGGIALTSNSNNDSDLKIPDITGKWNLAYSEIANLYTKEGKPITDANNVGIVERHFNPAEKKSVLEITKVGDHGFSGTLTYEKSAEIHGSKDGFAFRFIVETDNYLVKFEGIAKSDNHLSVALTIIKPPTEADPIPVICGFGYHLFIRDGGDPVPVRTDYFDMSIIKVGNHIRSVLHTTSDFTNETDDGKYGTDVEAKYDFVKAHTMVSLFNVYNKENTLLGVQAHVSMGKTPSGTVSGKFAGNLSQFAPGGKAGVVVGNMYMAHGKASFIAHFDHPGMVSPQFVEVDYNVPYYQGGDLSPVYLNSSADYKGTVTITEKNKETVTAETSKRFIVADNTFYCEDVLDGGNIIWFGEIYGHHIDVYVLNKQLKEVGRLTGHVDRDGILHIFGVMVDQEKSPRFIEFVLEPPKV